jgi:hypothetical protein
MKRRVKAQSGSHDGGTGTENARNRPTTNQIVDKEFKEYDKVKNNIERMR